MATVSKEVIDKLRQLSDLLIVIRDSANGTPQILKELAVEKCAEIYNALKEESSSEETVAITGISETSILSEVEEASILSEKNIEKGNTQIEETNFRDIIDDEKDYEERKDIISAEDEMKLEAIPLTETSETYLTNEEESKSEDNEAIEATEEDLPEPCLIESDEEEGEDEEYTQEDAIDDTNSDEHDDELFVEEDIDLFAPAKQTINKSSSHKKIRSVLSINDIFLYKREIFGNSDVDMTDIFDGIDESSSFEEAYEIISEYFGDDINSEEMIQEFIERVKSCFS